MSELFRPTEIIQRARRIVVKVGTSVLTDLRQARVTKFSVQSVAREIAIFWHGGREVVVVTSGAIGVGMGILGLRSRPRKLAKLQAAAATGQGLLMQWYTSLFEEQDLHAAQVLLTRADLEDRKRYLNARATLLTLLQAGIVPIVNENDTVSVEEIRYGDNDILSAHVAALVDADLLILLTDVDRLAGPLDPLSIVTEITPEIERAAGGTTKEVSTGGMRTKLQAARIAMESGIPMLLANGRGRANLLEMISKEVDRGTWFLPKKLLSAKRRWLAFTGRPKGVIAVDPGAKRALVSGGKSLLASGIQRVEGNFREGDLVSVHESARQGEFARGIVRYSHAELEKIKGLKSEAISTLLGRKAQEVIHRDQLVILKGAG